MKQMRAFTILATAVVLTACASQDEPSSLTTPVAMPVSPLADTSWKAERIRERNADAADSTLVFTGSDAVSGTTGCNRYTGSVTIDNTAIEFGLLATTRMMCTPPVNGQETVFLEALGDASGWRRIGSTLEFTDADNKAIMRLVQTEQPDPAE